MGKQNQNKDESETNGFYHVSENSRAIKKAKSCKKGKPSNKGIPKKKNSPTKNSLSLKAPISKKRPVTRTKGVSAAYNCQVHAASPVEFICTNVLCMQELCGHCILSHREHIQFITSLNTILGECFSQNEGEGSISIGSSGNSNLSQTMENLDNPNKLITEIKQRQKSSISQLEELNSSIKEFLNKRVDNLRRMVVSSSSEAVGLVENFQNLRVKAREILNNRSPLDAACVGLIKKYLSVTIGKQTQSQVMVPDRKMMAPNETMLSMNQALILKDIERTLEQNIHFSWDGTNLESTGVMEPKIIHWFEWGKKKLNIYDIVSNTTQTVELDINFKIPSFSRSIILPNSQVYLIGGEEPEYFPRKDVYMFDYKLNDRKLHQRASMPHKKFDFTLCHLNGFLYVICGKDSSSEVVDTCERFNINDNVWTSISSVCKKRYAASAIGFTNNKIYLFGGRSDFNNFMVSEIEEYSVEKNEWSLVHIRNGLNFWNPVEVCACIQISKDKILVFGGSDARIKDSSSSLIFNAFDYSFEKKSELKRPQVFVTAPFLFGRYVYAIGNEYYMKHRNLHKFSLEREEWDIIF